VRLRRGLLTGAGFHREDVDQVGDR
jgi:hypothetical protein